MGKTSVGRNDEIPISFRTIEADRRINVAIWWPESASQEHNRIFIRVLDPQGVERASSNLPLSVFQKARVGDFALPAGEWSLDLNGFYVPAGPQDVYYVIQATDLDATRPPTAPPSPSTDASWVMFGHDPQHTGRSPLPGPTNNVLAWFFPASSSGFADAFDPIIDEAGTVYVGSSLGVLHAVNPDGTVKWTFDPAPDLILGSPALGPDGTVYATGRDAPFNHRFLFAVKPDGSLRWKHPGYPGMSAWSIPTIAPDGTIYLGNLGCTISAVRPDASLKWSYSDPACPGQNDSAAAVGPDGTVYAYFGYWASLSVGIIALDPETGRLRWKKPIAGTPPSVGADGIIYTLGGDTLYAINPDGTTKWTLPGLTALSYAKNFSPTIGPDGTIYIPNYAINPDGTVKWQGDTFDTFYGSKAALSGDGVLYFPSFRGLMAIDASTGVSLWTFHPDEWSYTHQYSAVAIGANRVLYLGSAGGYYALHP